MAVNLADVTSNGMPNLGAIKTRVAAQGEGRLRVQTANNEFLVFHIYANGHDSYDAFIESRINYHGRAEGIHLTHRLDLNTSRPRICFSQNHPPRDLPTAVALTLYWAQCTARYIRTGVWA
jgi:hypothetical protein